MTIRVNRELWHLNYCFGAEMSDINAVEIIRPCSSVDFQGRCGDDGGLLSSHGGIVYKPLSPSSEKSSDVKVNFNQVTRPLWSIPMWPHCESYIDREKISCSSQSLKMYRTTHRTYKSCLCLCLFVIEANEIEEWCCEYMLWRLNLLRCCLVLSVCSK